LNEVIGAGLAMLASVSGKASGMKELQHQFLALVGQPPARLNVEQVAWLLGCQLHDVPVLIAAKLLKPLGNPPQNGVKFFATAELVEQMKERNWLTRVTVAINQHWQRKNALGKRRSSKNAAGELALRDADQAVSGVLTRV
jgi:hypothetical protein